MNIYEDLKVRFIKWTENISEKLYIYLGEVKNVFLKHIEIHEIFPDYVEVYDEYLGKEKEDNSEKEEVDEDKYEEVNEEINEEVELIK